MKVFFDIIIVSFNAGEKLSATVKSVLMQEGVAGNVHTDFRVVIKDGLSTDGSLERLTRELATYAKHLQSRVQIVSDKDDGIYDAMNRALDACLGPVGHGAGEEADVRHVVYFINCGDTFASSDVLETVADRILQEVTVQREHKTPFICYGDVLEEQTNERVTSNPKMDAFACYRHVPNHQACFYDAALFETERFDTSLKVRADYDHFLKSFFVYHAHCIYLPVLIAHYEGGGFSETKKNELRSKKEHRAVAARYFTEADIRKYDLRLKLTLQPVRTYLARNKKTAPLYQAVKRGVYTLRARGR